MKFKLFLENASNCKVALYDPYNSSLTWEDSGESVTSVHSNEKNWNKIHPTSPSNPANKVTSLKKIKIQLGFACNYTCNYCSQNSLRTSSELNAKEALEKVPAFLAGMSRWFDGGENGKGAGVDIEFWGGETLLYWSAVKKLAEELRLRYPDVHLGLFTNGSLIKKEMADFAAEQKIHFIISHDGPTFSEDRAKDPFDIPAQAENIIYLYKKLAPLKLVSFNATISVKNYSLVQTRSYIAQKLGVEEKSVVVTYDLATPYDAEGLNYVARADKRRDIVNSLFKEMKERYPFDLSLGMTDVFLKDFFDSLTYLRTGESVGQKCQMDLPTSIAVDLDGNVLTCQNVTVKGGHKIGHVNELEKVELTTAYHWSQRKECSQCPVVQICKGSCMFLTESLWTASCQQHFTWGLSYLALALYLITERKLVRIEGDNIRGTGDKSIEVLYS